MSEAGGREPHEMTPLLLSKVGRKLGVHGLRHFNAVRKLWVEVCRLTEYFTQIAFP